MKTPLWYISHLSDREKETCDFGSSLCRQGRRKQHSDVSVGVPYETPVRESPAKLYEDILFAKTMLPIEIYPKDVLGKT